MYLIIRVPGVKGILKSTLYFPLAPSRPGSQHNADAAAQTARNA